MLFKTTKSLPMNFSVNLRRRFLTKTLIQVFCLTEGFHKEKLNIGMVPLICFSSAGISNIFRHEKSDDPLHLAKIKNANRESL